MTPQFFLDFWFIFFEKLSHIMNIRSLIFFNLLIGLLFFSSCEKEETPIVTPTPPIVVPPTPVTPTPAPVVEGDFRIGFYNVENFFDTIDDPNNQNDNEYLPTAAKQWTNIRYQEKITNIGLVMEGINFPMLMGFSEVENMDVLEALAASDKLKPFDYGIVHYDSPDFRGIDVALLYKKADFTILESEAIEVDLPASVSEFSTTRDILLVKGSYLNEIVYVFVNHWSSRSGGVGATSGKREYAASILRQAMDDILEIEPNANIIAIGDFNDEPSNKSMLDVLKANLEKPMTIDNQLYNCSASVSSSTVGSYFFDGWQMIDQAVVSGRLLDDTGKMKVVGYNVFNDPLVLFDHPTDGPRPNRTYGGDEYFGGFSDHLAVYLEVKNL